MSGLSRPAAVGARAGLASGAWRVPKGAELQEAWRARGTAGGGTVVSGGIHMSDIPSFPYSLLWEERIIRSVANLTRQDGEELMKVASKVPIKIESHVFPLKEANNVLDRLREGKITGAAVLQISHS